MQPAMSFLAWVCLVAIVSFQSPGAHASPVVTVNIQTVYAALKMCAAPTAKDRQITVRGYFRNGPLTTGPIAVLGGLFDSDKVPDNAALPWNISSYHGLRFSISNLAPLARDPILQQIQPRSRLVVSGTLHCLGASSFLRPRKLRLVKSSESPLRIVVPRLPVAEDSNITVS